MVSIESNLFFPPWETAHYGGLAPREKMAGVGAVRTRRSSATKKQRTASLVFEDQGKIPLDACIIYIYICMYTHIYIYML